MAHRQGSLKRVTRPPRLLIWARERWTSKAARFACSPASTADICCSPIAQNPESHAEGTDESHVGAMFEYRRRRTSLFVATTRRCSLISPCNKCDAVDLNLRCSRFAQGPLRRGLEEQDLCVNIVRTLARGARHPRHRQDPPPPRRPRGHRRLRPEARRRRRSALTGMAGTGRKKLKIGDPDWEMIRRIQGLRGHPGDRQRRHRACFSRTWNGASP